MSVAETLTALGATSAGLVATVVDYLTADDDVPAMVGLAGAVTVGFAVLLFVGVVPRAKAREGGRDAETAFVTSAVGFLSVASAWKGLPFVLGAGGAMLGNAARRGDAPARQRGLGTFAVALGVVAVVLGCVAVIAL